MRCGGSSLLVPASPPVPTSTEKKQHYDDDEERRGIHIVLLWNPVLRSSNIGRVAFLHSSRVAVIPRRVLPERAPTEADAPQK